MWTLADHPVERLDQVVGVVERAVEADVDLRAGEQAEAAFALVPLADLLDPLPEPLGGDVVAEAVAGRVVGDRHVGVAALAAGLGHLLERVAAVGEGRVGVEVAADVAELDQVRQLALARRLQLAPPLAQLRLDVGVAEALVDVLLGRAELDLAALGLGDPVLGDREAAGHRLFAQLHVVGLGAGEVLEQVAEGLRGDDPQVDRDRRCGSARGRRWRPAVPAAAISGWAARCSASAAGSSAVAIRSMSLQVSAQRRTEPATSTRLAAGCSRSAAASSSAIGRTLESSSRPGPSPGSPRRSSEASTFSSAFGPSPFTSRICSRLGRCLQVLHGGDRRARRRGGARFSRRAPGTRVTSIRVGGNFAFSFTAAGISPVSSRASIFSASVLPTPGISVARPCAGQLGDRDRALADRLGRGAVGEHPVFDRAVELVEHAQLFQGRGDLGVGHGCKLAGASAIADLPPLASARCPLDRGRLAGPADLQRGREHRALGRGGAGEAARLGPGADRRRLLARRDRRDRRPARRAARERRASCTAPRKEGLGPAYIAGFRRALAAGAELVLEMDSDFSHDPAYLPRLLEAARRADLVLGSRYVAGGGVGDWGPLRQGDQPRRQRLRALVLGVDVQRPDRRLQVLPPRGAGGDRPRRGRGPRLRLPGRDDLPRDPRRLQGGRGADRLPRPPRRGLEDGPRDRRRGDLAGAAAALRPQSGKTAGTTSGRRRYTF